MTSIKDMRIKHLLSCIYKVLTNTEKVFPNVVPIVVISVFFVVNSKYLSLFY